MRRTIAIDERILVRARKLAEASGRTLEAEIEAALRLLFVERFPRRRRASSEKKASPTPIAAPAGVYLR